MPRIGPVTSATRTPPATDYGPTLQIWGQATSDPDTHTIVKGQMTAIEDSFAAAAERWLAASGGDVATARATARAMLTFCQGHIVRSAVFGPQDLTTAIADLALLGKPD